MLDKERESATVIDELKIEIKLLQEKIQYLMKKLFGRGSEKLSPDQMEMVFEELRELEDALEQAEETAEFEEIKESRRGKRKPLDERIPKDLPIELVVIIPEEVKAYKGPGTVKYGTEQEFLRLF